MHSTTMQGYALVVFVGEVLISSVYVVYYSKDHVFHVPDNLPTAIYTQILSKAMNTSLYHILVWRLHTVCKLDLSGRAGLTWF